MPRWLFLIFKYSHSHMNSCKALMVIYIFLTTLINLSSSFNMYGDTLSLLHISNYIKRLCVFVCPSRSLLSCIKSVWKAGGIVRTVSARAFYIPSFKKFHARVHAISRNFHAIWAISAIFGPISTCWVSKCMYSS